MKENRKQKQCAPAVNANVKVKADHQCNSSHNKQFTLTDRDCQVQLERDDPIAEYVQVVRAFSQKIVKNKYNPLTISI